MSGIATQTGNVAGAGGLSGVGAIGRFLPGLEAVLADEAVTEIMINGPGGAWVEKSGKLAFVGAPALSARKLLTAAIQIVRPLGLTLNSQHPLADARLSDGSRVAVVIPPAARSAVITIRRFGRRQFSAQTLVAVRALPPIVLEAVQSALNTRRNVLLSGGTGTGKTTMLAAFAGLIPEGDRLIVIEETAELRVDLPNVVFLEARKATIRDLVRASLRHRPDRIVVGEVRGAEASDLLDALSTGHGGSLSTIHANDATGALSRLATEILRVDGHGQTLEAVCYRIAAGIDLVVQVGRRGGKRGVTEAIEVEGYLPRTGGWSIARIWPPAGVPVGEVGWTGDGSDDGPVGRLRDELAAAEGYA